MDTPEEADKAIEEMSGFELKGRAMTVNQATERPQGTGAVATEGSDPEVVDTKEGTTTVV